MLSRRSHIVRNLGSDGFHTLMSDEAFSAILEQYSDDAYNIAYYILNNPADAEDVVQDAYLSAYRARHTYRGDAAVTTWLYHDVVNAALQKTRNDRQLKSMNGGDPEHIEVVDRRPVLGSETPNADQCSVLQKALRELPEDLRTAVVLRDIQQLTNAECAAILGIGISAFKARLHCGRVALRDMIFDTSG